MTPDELHFLAGQQEFILEHLKSDPAALALKLQGREHSRLLVEQIACRQKIAKKIPEWYRHPGLIFPGKLSGEQASSAETARLKASLIRGKKLLDITGGLGVDCYYLSQSFTQAVYVEKNPALALAAKHNYAALETKIEVVEGNGLSLLAQTDADVIYADPYRRDAAKERVISLKDSEPDLTQHLDLLIAEGRQSLIKTSPMLDISQGLAELQYVREIWVISLRNDCKEVVYKLSAAGRVNSLLIRSFNLGEQGLQEFSAPWAERKLTVALSDPGTYLYEPNSAVLKAELQDACARQFKLAKLHPNSNIYTAEVWHNNYPGKVFKLEEESKAFDKKWKKGRFNVISRNFPEKASEIEKKLKIKSSRDHYLIATRLKDDSLRFLIARLQ